MPNVKLIDFTGCGRKDESLHAAHILVFTKATRLNMNPSLFQQIKDMPEPELSKELDYMAGTIPSSWEFVDLTFLISNVTRACAQQITRTRTASYAMQSQRVNDLSGATVTNPYEPGHELYDPFDASSAATNDIYKSLISRGATPQDARGILPMNVQCNLVAKYNLRSLVELLQARRSLRTQGEYATIADQMYAAVLEVWPWAKPFFADKHASAIELLEAAAKEVGITTGTGPGWSIAKAIDLLRKS